MTVVRSPVPFRSDPTFKDRYYSYVHHQGLWTPNFSGPTTHPPTLGSTRFLEVLCDRFLPVSLGQFFRFFSSGLQYLPFFLLSLVGTVYGFSLWYICF